MAIALAIAAAAVYGAADFFGGLATRKAPATLVVFLSQCAGLPALAFACAYAPPHFGPVDLWAGLFAGVAGIVAIVALYGALAVGRMGIVSPITAAVGAAVPVAFGIARGEHPSGLAIAGIACAALAIVLTTANFSGRALSFLEPGLGLALISGLAIGGLYVLLAGSSSGGLGRLVAARAISFSLLGGYCLFRRTNVREAAGSWRLIVAAGAFDALANIFYLFAAQHGALAIVAVVTSLYPASTVLLALIVLRERLGPLQWTGVAFAVAGVVLISR